MAELGLLANLAGVIGAGLVLSRVLYDFASVLGSASQDVKDLATNISLFCSVLKHVQTTLNRAKAYRLSMTAVQTAQDIVDRCQTIFTDLHTTIDRLQKGHSKLDLLTRVKWFFKEKRVLLIHEQLRTCTATLHLMLTTLTLAQKIAAKRLSIISTDSNDHDDEDSQDRMMTHALFMAQQAANERLATAEDEAILEQIQHQADSSTPSSSSTTGQLAASNTDTSSNAQNLRHRRNRSSQMIYGAIHSPLQSSSSGFDRHKRVSIILGNHINRMSLVSSMPTLDENRLSVLQTDELLRNWTDQSDPLAASEEEKEDERQVHCEEEQQTEQTSEDDDITPSPRLHAAAEENQSPMHDFGSIPIPRDTNNSNHQKSPSPPRGIHSIVRNPDATPRTAEQTINPESEVEIFKSFRIAFDDPTRKVLPKALKKYNVAADPRLYQICIKYGDEERLLGLDEQPLVIFKDLDRKGKKPMFVVRKVKDSTLESALPHQSPPSTPTSAITTGAIIYPKSTPNLLHEPGTEELEQLQSESADLKQQRIRQWIDCGVDVI